MTTQRKDGGALGSRAEGRGVRRGRGRSKSVSGKQLKIIGKQPLSKVVDLAVSRALRTQCKNLDPKLGFAIRDAAQAQFLELLSDNGRSVRGTTRSRFLLELDRERNTVLQARDKARDELNGLRESVEDIRKRQAQEEREFERASAAYESARRKELSQSIRTLFEMAELGHISLEKLEKMMVSIAVQASQEERKKVFVDKSSDYEQQAENFERRISKLMETLGQTEAKLAEIAKLKTVDPGIASIYRTVQGLDGEDPKRAVKEQLLVKLFESNKALQLGDVDASSREDVVHAASDIA